MCLELSVRRVKRPGLLATLGDDLPYFRVELPEPKVVFVLVDSQGEPIGLNEIPAQHRPEVLRLITLATTGYEM